MAQLVLSRSRDAWVIATPPEVERIDEATLASDLDALLEAVRRGGGGPVRWFISDHEKGACTLAAELGFTSERTLLQMRVPLPLTPAVRRPSDPIDVRAFRPGIDDDSWLAVNNAAFAGHPEQGNWGAAMLAERIAEPWFSATDFLVHEEAEEIVGFCWTKVHANTRPPMGEIFVIGVHPNHHGKGLGRRLVVAGLDHLTTRNVSTGMLYVDVRNEAAVAMYQSLGFRPHRRDVAWSGHISSR
jgi:mycothiol synthase